MLTENPVLMKNAWYSLNGRWKDAVIATLIFVMISAASSSMAPLGFIILGPLTLGYVMFIFAFMDKAPAGKFETLFEGFNNFLNAFIAQLLMSIFIFLWALLLFVPGIVASYSYAMTFFIMNDNPGMSGQDAITASKELMRGNRWKLFCLDLRFIGWWILCMLTLGVLTLWVTPYWYTAHAMFYRDLLAQNAAPLHRQYGFYVPPSATPDAQAEPPFAP